MIYIHDVNSLESLRQNSPLSGQNSPLSDLFLGHDSLAWGFLSFFILFSFSIPTIVALARGHSTVLFIFIVSIALLPLQFPSATGSIIEVRLESFQYLIFLLLSMWSFFGPKKKGKNLVEEKSVGPSNYFKEARERFPVLNFLALFFMKFIMSCLCSFLNIYTVIIIGQHNFAGESRYFYDSLSDLNRTIPLQKSPIIFGVHYYSFYIFIWGIIFAGLFWISLLLKSTYSKEKRHPLTILFLQTYVIFFLLVILSIMDQEFLYFFIGLGYIGGFVFIFLPFVFSCPTILASLWKHPYLYRILLLNILCFLLLSPGIFEFLLSPSIFERTIGIERIIGSVGNFYVPGIFMAFIFWLALLLWAFSGTGKRLENSEHLV